MFRIYCVFAKIRNKVFMVNHVTVFLEVWHVSDFDDFAETQKKTAFMVNCVMVLLEA